jgi:5-methylcytosine-specific restriction endonuclease McrA
VHFEPHRRSRASIPPKLRREVLARDGHRCRRCGRTAHLNVHHRHKQEHGGAHTLNNCETLCRACHVVLHREEELLQRGITVDAPG